MHVSSTPNDIAAQGGKAGADIMYINTSLFDQWEGRKGEKGKK
jgi:hypothetical protein